MIKWYRFKNFQSYLDDCFVDFTVNKKSAHSYFDYLLDDETKITKVMSVLGGNGSGKSNLIKPLSFLSWFIPMSFKSMDKDEKIPFYPHFSATDINTEIEIEFILPKLCDSEESTEIEYKYFIEMNRERVVKEELKIKTSRLFTTVFNREYSDGKYTIKKNNGFLNIPHSMLDKAPNNCSLVSYIYRMSDDGVIERKVDTNVIDLVYHHFYFSDSNLNLNSRTDASHSIISATKSFAENTQLFNIVKDLLIKYDLGLSDIVIEEKSVIDRDGEETNMLVPICVHKHNDSEYRLPLYLESTGTQSAYCKLASIAQTLDFGGVSVLDEFDSDLHPQLTVEILNLFKDTKINNKNSQIIFTSHSPEILKSLRRQNCYLVEKVNCESSAWRTDEVEGLKERDNLYAKYISGALGGTPNFD
ncbi:AAA family ATPase [Shewanella baltica]|uniref:AAA family ATPase n=1 Tax=Shewanella baltica TaxID=62322 RepID=UPI00217D13AC|nr:ATP-binding protein [Shewanella baltica]MCS6173190.1 ATP-binding protein [Shewanella baltica]